MHEAGSAAWLSWEMALATSDGQGFAFGLFAFILRSYLIFKLLGYGETSQQCFSIYSLFATFVPFFKSQ